MDLYAPMINMFHQNSVKFSNSLSKTLTILLFLIFLITLFYSVPLNYNTLPQIYIDEKVLDIHDLRRINNAGFNFAFLISDVNQNEEEHIFDYLNPQVFIRNSQSEFLNSWNFPSLIRCSESEDENSKNLWNSVSNQLSLNVQKDVFCVQTQLNKKNDDSIKQNALQNLGLRLNSSSKVANDDFQIKNQNYLLRLFFQESLLETTDEKQPFHPIVFEYAIPFTLQKTVLKQIIIGYDDLKDDFGSSFSKNQNTFLGSQVVEIRPTDFQISLNSTLYIDQNNAESIEWGNTVLSISFDLRNWKKSVIRRYDSSPIYFILHQLGGILAFFHFIFYLVGNKFSVLLLQLELIIEYSKGSQIVKHINKHKQEDQVQKSLNLITSEAEQTTFNSGIQFKYENKEKSTYIDNQFDIKFDQVKRLIQSEKDRFKLSSLEQFQYFFFCFSKNMKIKQKILTQIGEKLVQNLTPISILKQHQEIDKLKAIVLDENQLTLFPFIPEPSPLFDEEIDFYDFMKNVKQKEEINSNELHISQYENISQKDVQQNGCIPIPEQRLKNNNGLRDDINYHKKWALIKLDKRQLREKQQEAIKVVRQVVDDILNGSNNPLNMNLMGLLEVDSLKTLQEMQDKIKMKDFMRTISFRENQKISEINFCGNPNEKELLGINDNQFYGQYLKTKEKSMSYNEENPNSRLDNPRSREIDSDLSQILESRNNIYLKNLSSNKIIKDLACELPDLSYQNDKSCEALQELDLQPLDEEPDLQYKIKKLQTSHN